MKLIVVSAVLSVVFLGVSAEVMEENKEIESLVGKSDSFTSMVNASREVTTKSRTLYARRCYRNANCKYNNKNSRSSLCCGKYKY